MNDIYEVNLKVAEGSQIRFLEEVLSRWLNEQDKLYGCIKFLYRLEFEKDLAVYVGTGSVARITSRVSGKVLDYDNPDLVAYTQDTYEEGLTRTLRCIGLFQVGCTWDVGQDFERFDKRRCLDSNKKLLNRSDLYNPVDEYRLVVADDWFGEEGLELFHQLGKGQLSRSEAVRIMGLKKAPR